MKRLGPRTLAAFPARILNTHPALLPKFGGQGMFGDRVFEAVLAGGESESGASVHLVDAEYDTGAVVSQERIRVFPGDTVESLKARVQASANSSSRRWLRLRAASWYYLPLDYLKFSSIVDGQKYSRYGSQVDAPPALRGLLVRPTDTSQQRTGTRSCGAAGLLFPGSPRCVDRSDNRTPHDLAHPSDVKSARSLRLRLPPEPAANESCRSASRARTSTSSPAQYAPSSCCTRQSAQGSAAPRS
jgi:hypothetical protein